MKANNPPSSKTSCILLLFAWILILTSCSPDPYKARARVECASRMVSIYQKLLQGSPQESISLSRIGDQYGPFDLQDIDLGDTSSPILNDLTSRKKQSGYWLTYAIKKRNESSWSYGLNLDNIEVPVLFVDESFGQGDDYGKGLVLRTGGQVRVDWLPLLAYISKKSEVAGILTIEIQIPKNDPRFPYGIIIEKIKAQKLPDKK